MTKNTLLILFALTSQFCNAQTITNHQKHKGIFIEVGQVQTNSLNTLNEALANSKLPTFSPQMLYLKYGYYIVGKRNIYLSISGEYIGQNKSDATYSLGISSSQLGVSLGYRVFDKKRFSIIPNISGSAGGTILSVSDGTAQSTNAINFKDALLQSKTITSNTLALAQVGVSASLIGFYKVGLTDDEEVVQNGTLIIQRWLPVGFEIGYKFGRDVDNWVLLTKSVTNSPNLNLSGIFFCVRIGGVLKDKSIKN